MFYVRVNRRDSQKIVQMTLSQEFVVHFSKGLQYIVFCFLPFSIYLWCFSTISVYVCFIWWGKLINVHNFTISSNVLFVSMDFPLMYLNVIILVFPLTQAVICSGSTLGSYIAVHNYVRVMLASMDSVKCWLKGQSRCCHLSVVIVCDVCCVLCGAQLLQISEALVERYDWFILLFFVVFEGVNCLIWD